MRAPDDIAAIPIHAEICDGARFEECRAAFADLAERAVHPNPFMDPGVVRAAEEHGYRMVVLLVWRSAASRNRDLVGAWALSRTAPSVRMPVAALSTSINRLTFVGTPVIDRDLLRPVVSAMLDAIAGDPSQPNIVFANDIYCDGPLLSEMTAVLQSRGVMPRIVETRTRAKLEIDSDPETFFRRQFSTRRQAEARRYSRLLQAAGGAFRRCRDAGEIGAAFEEFLALEKSGWKGKRSQGGYAIALEPSLEAFARSMIRNLAEHGTAEAQTVQLGGRSIAVNIWLRSGRVAAGWKQAFDESFRSLSPGTLLNDEVTRTIIEDRALTTADSCNRTETGPHAGRWPDRLVVADLVLDAKRGGSAAFAIIAGGESAVRRGLARARQARALARAGVARLKASVAIENGKRQACYLGAHLQWTWAFVVAQF